MKGKPINCPKCLIRPRHISKSGNEQVYCKECRREITKKQIEDRKLITVDHKKMITEFVQRIESRGGLATQDEVLIELLGLSEFVRDCDSLSPLDQIKFIWRELKRVSRDYLKLCISCRKRKVMLGHDKLCVGCYDDWRELNPISAQCDNKSMCYFCGEHPRKKNVKTRRCDICYNWWIRKKRG